MHIIKIYIVHCIAIVDNHDLHLTLHTSFGFMSELD